MKKNAHTLTAAEREAKAVRRNKIMYALTLASFVLPIIYIVIRMVFFSDSVSENEAGYHSHADYILMIVECLLGCFVINIPTLLSKRFKFEIPALLYTSTAQYFSEKCAAFTMSFPDGTISFTR